MDYVDDPKALLRTMETKRIGVKRALFYQAYALYYEKIKKFEDAEKMYRLGVQNLAEPLDELQKSYEQFLVRLGRHKYKRVQRLERRTSRRPVSERTTLVCSNNNKESNENPSNVQSSSASSLARESSPKREPKDGISGPSSMLRGTSQNVKLLNAIKSNELTRDDSAVAKFVDSAIVGKSEAENACHHGLVEPTINTKEAMDAINNMFREPFEPANIVRRSTRSQPKIAKSSSDGIAVFIDEDFDNGLKPSNQESEKTRSPLQETLQIFIDDEEDEVEGDINRKDGSETSEAQTSPSSSSRVGGFVFLKPDDYHSESSDGVKTERSVKPKFREDTVVCRFVGSAILDEPEVENICHHGLVDPTVNLKQAIDDINSMFGKPIDFVRATRKKRKEKAAASGKMGGDVFTILPDEDLVPQEDKKPLPSSRGKDGDDLFEPTVFTKQAMDDINDMFRMPLDF